MFKHPNKAFFIQLTFCDLKKSISPTPSPNIQSVVNEYPNMFLDVVFSLVTKRNHVVEAKIARTPVVSPLRRKTRQEGGYAGSWIVVLGLGNN